MNTMHTQEGDHLRSFDGLKCVATIYQCLSREENHSLSEADGGSPKVRVTLGLSV